MRFVDLSFDYFALDPADDPDYVISTDDFSPICAFIDTIVDRFVMVEGQHTFCCVEDFEPLGYGLKERLLGLVPEGFFDVQSEYWKERLAKLKSPG